jgi:hypothetical protein
MTAWHDTALDWDYPPDPSPWTDEERARFSQAAARILLRIQGELGDGFRIRFEPIEDREGPA